MQTRIAFGATLFLLSIVASTAPASVEPPRQLHFDVFLDDRPIGYQTLSLTPIQDGLRVEIEAAFDVTLLRLKAFEYDHRNVEQWRHGCLHSIESSTQQNGKPYHVTGSAGSEGFSVSSNLGSQDLPRCVGTFSYWDKDALLERSKLLNSQTGEYVAIGMRALGRGTTLLGDRKIPVERYVIEGKDLEITLAYAVDGGEWVALDSPLWGGWTLRYRRSATDLPSTSSSAQPLPN